MAQTSINIRIDENLKYDFETVCEQIGLTMTAAFNVFAKAVCSRKEIPFKLTTKEIITPDEEWGHLLSDNLLNSDEAAGIAGDWDKNIQALSNKKSVWADAAIKKEINRKRNVKKYGTVGY